MEKRVRNSLLVMLLLSVLLVAAANFWGYRSGAAGMEAREERAARIVQYFGGVTFDGEPVTADLLKGHTLTVLNVWATDCGPCIAEMPDLNALSEEYAAQDVQFLGLCTGNLSLEHSSQIQEEARGILEQCGVTYRNIFPTDEFLTGFLDENVVTFPTTFFFDENGQYIDHTVGANIADNWRLIIDTHLQQQKEG